jgi:diacylglycerol kinase family enzyme
MVLQEKSGSRYLTGSTTPVSMSAFVNPHSGSKKGRRAIELLARRGISVFDLSSSDSPDQFLEQVSTRFTAITDSNHIVIAAGGDGTVSFVVSLLHRHKIKCPVVPLPLGTGNEFAFNTGWRHAGKLKKIDEFLDACLYADEADLDCWSVRLETGTGKIIAKTFQSFLSIGVDANVVYDHATLLQKHPHWFRFRFLSLFWYLVFGLYEAFFRLKHIGQHMQFTVDGTVMPVPNAGIFHFLNIPTSGGHTDYFGINEFFKSPPAGFVNPSIHDGLIEIAATETRLAFLRSALKMGHVTRLAQARAIDIVINPDFPQRLQIDGEKIDECVVAVSIRWAGRQKILLGPGRRRGC